MIGSVTSRATLSSLRKDGSRGRCDPFRVMYLPHEEPTRLVAFALSRRFGNAVERNRAKRRMREMLRTSIPQLADGSYLFTCQRRVLTEPHGLLVASLNDCIASAVAVKRSSC